MAQTAEKKTETKKNTKTKTESNVINLPAPISDWQERRKAMGEFKAPDNIADARKRLKEVLVSGSTLTNKVETDMFTNIAVAIADFAIIKRGGDSGKWPSESELLQECKDQVKDLHILNQRDEDGSPNLRFNRTLSAWIDVSVKAAILLTQGIADIRIGYVNSQGIRVMETPSGKAPAHAARCLIALYHLVYPVTMVPMVGTNKKKPMPTPDDQGYVKLTQAMVKHLWDRDILKLAWDKTEDKSKREQNKKDKQEIEIKDATLSNLFEALNAKLKEMKGKAFSEQEAALAGDCYALLDSFMEAESAEGTGVEKAPENAPV